MGLSNYIISVVAASMIAGILVTLTKTDRAYGYFIKLLAGLFIALTVISPWKSVYLPDIGDYFRDWEAASNIHSESGVYAYNETLQASITERTEAYILEKATSMGAELTATVTVSNEQPPVPIAVTLTGNISPYNKAHLKQIIMNDLGIPEDAQHWN